MGLDVEARRSFWEQVRGSVEAGRTVILTTHYLEEADALADRVVVIDRHMLAPTEDGATRHYLEESLAGVLVPLFFGSAKLKAQHQRWLSAFKAAAEY